MHIYGFKNNKNKNKVVKSTPRVQKDLFGKTNAATTAMGGREGVRWASYSMDI